MHCMFWANICRPKFILRHSRSRAKDSLQLTNEAKVNSCGGAIKRQQGPNSEGRREAAMHGKGHASHAAHNEARLGGRQFSANNSPWRGRPTVAVRPSVWPLSFKFQMAFSPVFLACMPSWGETTRENWSCLQRRDKKV